MEAFLTVGGAPRQTGAGADRLRRARRLRVVDCWTTRTSQAIVRDFGDRNVQEDPVIHFYELFLKQYDPDKRMQRGVFYTPLPVVSYIVESAHEGLRETFGLRDGLADISTWGEVAAANPLIRLPAGVDPEEPFVRILDPAAGTGTFLVEAIDVIFGALNDR